ncbi:MAG: hypothetical protein AAGU02_03005 [Lawsonibacter sp.]
MANRNHTKGAALLVCLLFCFAMAFSVFFIAAEANHDCTGEDCSICAEIRACTNVLGSAALVAAAAAACSTLPARRMQDQCCDGAEHNRSTLVSLKVKLSN